MNRAQLEHIIRAASDICDDRELIIIGSQAILGSNPDAPPDLLMSLEADVIPRNNSDRAIEIDGVMGELSPFHTTFGYYAHGVSEETAVLPEGWRDRLIPIRNVNTHDNTGWCLAPTDIAVSKLAAGRDKDIAFVTALLRHHMIEAEDVRRAITPLPDETRRSIEQNISHCEARAT